MNIKFHRMLPLAALAIALAGCMHNPIYEKPGDSTFGEANRQTMMAQIINPEPTYSEPMTSSADHAAQAIDRYNKGQVKQPERMSPSSGTGGGSGSSVGASGG